MQKSLKRKYDQLAVAIIFSNDTQENKRKLLKELEKEMECEELLRDNNN